MFKKLINDKRSKFIITLVSVVIAAFLQAYVLNVFIQPTNLLSSGFTGVAILIEKITSLFGFFLSYIIRNDFIKFTSCYFML